MKLKHLSLILLSSLLAACSGNTKYPADPNDPYQSYNRAMFEFNNGFYASVAEPVSGLYNSATPGFFRTGVRNFFRNVGLIPGLANDALQWNWCYFAKDTFRLVLNTTLGLGGVFDVAGSAGVPWHPQGFGYTLAKWGGPEVVNNPGFIELPFLGPNTISGTIGLAVDIYTYPIMYVNQNGLRYGLEAGYIVQQNADSMPQYQNITSTALDPYVAIRESYLQNRRYNIQQIIYDGHVPESVQQETAEQQSVQSPALQ